MFSFGYDFFEEVIRSSFLVKIFCCGESVGSEPVHSKGWKMGKLDPWVYPLFL